MDKFGNEHLVYAATLGIKEKNLMIYLQCILKVDIISERNYWGMEDTDPTAHNMDNI